MEPTLTSLEIAAVPPLTSLGDTVILSATARDQRGRVITGQTLAWTTSNPLVATVNQTGVARAIGNGTAIISVAVNGVKDTLELIVSQAVSTLSASPRLLVSLGDTVQVSVVARDARGSLIPNVAPTWSSSDPSVATITAEGKATAVDNGVTTVTATAGGRQASTTVTVDQRVSSITVAPTTATLAPGETIMLSATLFDARGNLVRHKVPSWSTLDTNIAVISQAGLLTAIGRKLDSVRVGASGDGVQRFASVDLRVEFVAISAASSHTCAITTTGVLYCWGTNEYSGQLGTNGYTGSVTTDAKAPVAVASSLRFRSVSANDHTCAVAADNRALCWGYGVEGGLGNGSGVDSPLPVLVSGGHSFSAISAASSVSCGINSDGAALCWGNSYQGSLGDNDFTETDRYTPVPVSGGLTFSALSTDGGHTCAIATGGAPYCWGSRARGSVGDGTQFGEAHVPTLVSGSLVAESVSSNRLRSCVITTTKAVFCWGWNANGELATGDSVNRATPTAVMPGTQFATVSAGSAHTCAITPTGTAMCWGVNRDGQLGIGSRTHTIAPTAVSGGITFATISAGGQHTCGISTAGVTYCWGSNVDGQLGTNGPSGQVGLGELTPAIIRGSRRP